jgi:uncharacterized protein YbjT (DUF2867 family)
VRVVVTGATGNVGTSVMESLATEPRVNEVVAVARRAPGREFPRTRFESAGGSLGGGIHEIAHSFRSVTPVVQLQP